ncbi:phosphopantetheine-binding protein [Photobacterium sp. MCCC 1A19761]|uniref:acyl carrier protein n=1 Tax=unclassified Photobacterium TaxID=2628852 RepID=UPI0021C0879B|nr:phosphopantetheine-binding protein [Photobacterium sp. TY1-4]UXI00496.1 phosphopantetheine-binding protein [Photobacterium sp. TY1-4]
MFEQITTLIAEIKKDPSLKETITLESHLIEDVGLDSLDIIDFLLQLEAEFDLRLDFDQLDFSIMQSVQALMTFIAEQQSEVAADEH